MSRKLDRGIALELDPDQQRDSTEGCSQAFAGGDFGSRLLGRLIGSFSMHFDWQQSIP
jgi:hypothetical protein